MAFSTLIHPLERSQLAAELPVRLEWFGDESKSPGYVRGKYIQLPKHLTVDKH